MASAQPGSADWKGERGEKWLSQLTGMEAMLSPVDDPLFDALRLDRPYRIAEIGCGGGGTAMELRRRAPTGSVIHGFDISPALIAEAQRREPAVRFAVADMATSAPDKPYDRLVSRFGVMFFDEPQGAFTNLARWLVPGGRFAFAVWGPPADNEWVTQVRDVTAEFVEIPRPDPEAPGPFRYAKAEKLLGLLERGGFAELTVADWRGELPIGGSLSPEEAAAFALGSFSAFAELLTNAGEKTAAAAQRLLAERLTAHQTNGVIRMRARVHIITGKRNS